jgi:putative methyltransferase (TIGR04325 family)
VSINAKSLIKALLPPIAITAWQRLFNPTNRQPILFNGDFASWEEARRLSTGYSSQVIFERTRQASLKVKNGEAVFERDSVLFDKADWSWPLIACLSHVALVHGGRLCVLDFGGALGSIYLSYRTLFDSVPHLRWCVVEQMSYVDCGRKEFCDERLVFYSDVAECRRLEKPNVLLCSSVLQYLESPWAFVAASCEDPFEFILIDRTTVFRTGTRDRLTVQTVPEWIYPASYPCWMLNYDRLRSSFEQGYDVIAEFVAESGAVIPFKEGNAEYAGLFLRGKST